jgi:hypothetical protein
LTIYFSVNTKKIIYIAGYGYSGSTILERILASHSQIIGCGEMHNLLSDFNIKEICSCGSSLEDCSLWKNVYAHHLKDNTSVDSINVFSILSENTSDEIVFICDSSKTTWGTMLRPYKLSKNHEVYLIHLCRNGKSCLSSILKRKGNSGMAFKALSTGIHWSIANLMAYWFQMNKPNRYFRLKYENLINNPESSIAPLFEYLGLDGQSIEKGLANKASIPLTHQLSGNAIRRKKDLVLKSVLKPNKPIHFLAITLFQIISWPIHKLIGY